MAVSVVVKVVKGRDSDFRATAVLEMVAAKAKAKAAAVLALTVHWYDLRDRQKEKERERERKPYWTAHREHTCNKRTRPVAEVIKQS